MKKTKALIVYYSRTGATRKAAEKLKTALKCDSEEIFDTKDRSGLVGYMKSGRDAMKKNLTEIKKTKKDPAKYGLVIIGTPNWAHNVSTPIRPYLTDNYKKLKKVAFLVTMGGSGADAVCREMGSICKKKPVSCLHLTTKEVMQGNCREKMDKFVKKVNM